MAAEKVGVELLVQGLSEFKGGMGDADKAIQSLIPGSGLLTGAFEAVGNVFSSVADFAANVLAHALGELLADAVQWLNDKIWEVIDSSIELAGELQALEIRLNQTNFVELAESGMEFTEAMEAAQEATAEQIDWIQDLSLATPFTNQQIAEVYNMVRALGKTHEETTGLIEVLADFSAGMGLTGDAMAGVVRQFSQMERKGKIMQQDLNVLAENGVPVNAILDKMQEKTGLTGKAFDDFKRSGEGVQMFMETFTELVNTRFVGAAERANRTFQNASNTMKDFFATFIAEGITKPLLDLFGEKMAAFNDILAENRDKFEEAFGRIGGIVVEIIEEITGLGPSAEDTVTMILDGLNNVADWLGSHKDDIVGFFRNAYDYIQTTLIPALKDVRDWLFGTAPVEGTEGQRPMGGEEAANFDPGTSGTIGFLEKMKGLLDDMQPLVQPIKDLFSAIGEVAAAAMGIEFGDLSDKTFAENVKSIADKISELAKWISDNKEEIAAFVVGVLIAIAIMGTWLAIIGGILSAIISVAGWILTLTLGLSGLSTAIGFLSPIFAFLGTVIAGISLPIILLVAGIAFVAYMLYYHGEEMWTTIKQLNFIIGYYLNKMIQAFFDFAYKTGAKIATWVSETWAKFTEWVKQTWDKFLEWKAGMLEKFEAWRAEMAAKITEWKNNMLTKFSEMKASTIAKVNEWKTELANKVNEIKTAILNKFNELKAGVEAKLREIKQKILEIWNSAIDSVSEVNFFDAGYQAMQSMAEGISSGASLLYDAVTSAAQSAWDAVQGIFTSEEETASTDGSRSAVGVKSAATSVAPTTTTTPVPSTTSVSTVNNYNLTINTSAAVEPIIDDFGMMSSLSQ